VGADLLSETHVQYDAKDHDHDRFREIGHNFFLTFHSTGTIPDPASGNQYVLLESVVLQWIRRQPTGDTVDAPEACGSSWSGSAA
jgi:hypothetical protein